MKLLPIDFDGRADQKAFKFHQLQRTGTHALYVKSLKSGNGGESYEVIRVRQAPTESRSIGGKLIELSERELFPPPEQWGTEGWTCLTLEDAKKRFYSTTP